MVDPVVSHVSPDAQVVPHAPQFVGPVLKFVSQPLTAISSQFPKPAAHARSVHEPATQPATPLTGVGHLLPHPPQWLGSMSRLISQPSIELELQLPYPPAQNEISHCPALLQLAMALAGAHGAQLEASPQPVVGSATLTHLSTQAFSPAGHTWLSNGATSTVKEQDATATATKATAVSDTTKAMRGMRKSVHWEHERRQLRRATRSRSCPRLGRSLADGVNRTKSGLDHGEALECANPFRRSLEDVRVGEHTSK
ncbi:MAG: hypothetical protein EOP08_13995 [Proteobacteria bacterium]|nr:MAG: hypothetical protein EOP08_13995 [Pseudomonadota bacterium]